MAAEEEEEENVEEMEDDDFDDVSSVTSASSRLSLDFFEDALAECDEVDGHEARREIRARIRGGADVSTFPAIAAYMRACEEEFQKEAAEVDEPQEIADDMAEAAESESRMREALVRELETRRLEAVGGPGGRGGRGGGSHGGGGGGGGGGTAAGADDGVYDGGYPCDTEDALEKMDAADADAERAAAAAHDAAESFFRLLGDAHLAPPEAALMEPHSAAVTLVQGRAFGGGGVAADVPRGPVGTGHAHEVPRGPEALAADMASVTAATDALVAVRPNLKRKRAREWENNAVRNEQRRTGLVIDERTFSNLVREVGQDYGSELEWTPDALQAVQQASEDYLVELFGHAGLVAARGGRRRIVEAGDLEIVRAICGERR